MRVIIGNVQSPANPLLRAVYILLGAVAFVAALFFGAIVLAFIIGFVVIAGSIAAARIWWIRRKLERAASGSGPGPQSGGAGGGRVIEGEFAEIHEKPPESDG